MRALSHVFSVIRGSVGGITYTAGRNHSIVGRSRVGPARQATNLGNTVRTCLQLAQGLWRTLTDSVRQGWDDYAQTVTFTGPLGTYKLTGFQMFIRSIVSAAYWNETAGGGFSLAGAAPVTPGLPNIGPIVVSPLVAVGIGVALSVTNSSGLDATALLKVSIPWGPGRLKDPNIWDTSKNEIQACPDAASTLVEILSLIDEAVYFVSIRMILDDPPVRLDTEYIFRIVAAEVTI